VARIYPAFTLCLASTFLIVSQARIEPVRDWVANVFLVQTLHPGWQIAPLNHLWSLSTEVTFYLALPLLAWVLRAGPPVGGYAALRRQAIRLGACIVFAWVFRSLVSHGYIANLAALSWLPAHLDWFAAGMLLAVLRTGAGASGWGDAAVSTVRQAPAAVRILALLLLWLGTTRLAGPYDLRPATASEDLVKHLIYLVAAVAIVAPSALDAGDGLSRFLSTSGMAWLGSVSYGVFLWHLPIMFAVQEGLGFALFGGQFWAVLSVTLAVTVPVAAASWYLLEHPILRAAHQATRRAPDPVPEPNAPPATQTSAQQG
jgi:peptidoglycan/LPS O-acetylase OafA/YrhL